MSEGNEAARPAILVVDDSETDRTLVTGLISGERPEWEVLSRAAAAEGLDVLAERPITTVVTDLFMPEMSGEEFLLEIRRRFPTIPVILITSQGTDEIAARSLELGAVNYVPKRHLSNELVPAIDEVLRGTAEAAIAQDVLTHLVHSRTIFRIDSHLEQIRSLLLLIRERMQSLQTLEDDEVRQVTDAVREALMNAYTHGRNVDCSPAAESIIEVELTQTPDRVCFCFTDQGSGFDTSIYCNADASGAGNGFRTIRRHMDHVEFNERGNQIALTKELTSPPTE